MKVLLDTCVWGGVRAQVEAAGHDVVWAGDWAEDPGDDRILARAYDEHRILVTLDKDFGELAIVMGAPQLWDRPSGELSCSRSSVGLRARVEPSRVGTAFRGDCHRVSRCHKDSVSRDGRVNAEQ